MKTVKNIDLEFAVQGFKLIAGADEAGRGAWAGPLIIAAVIMPAAHVQLPISGITDSKKISETKREQLFPLIMEQTVACSIVSLSQAEIDELGVHRANLFAISYALTHLDVTPDLALIDGYAIEHFVPTRQVIDGDAKSYSIGAASIVTKVVRDRMMRRAERVCGGYYFHEHKGYGTAVHRRQLERLGVSALHRRSYAPIQQLLARAVA